LSVIRKNKQGRNSLRQIGLALLVDRYSRLPIHYREYRGNCHDSKVFGSLLEELIAAMREAGGKELTLVVDKGMNSPENFQFIDGQEDVHFITSYSPSFAEELVLTSRDRFVLVETPRNKRLEAKNRHEDCLLVSSSPPHRSLRADFPHKAPLMRIWRKSAFQDRDAVESVAEPSFPQGV